MEHYKFAQMIEPTVKRINEKIKERTGSDFLNVFVYQNDETTPFVNRCYVNGELSITYMMAYFTNDQIINYLEVIESIWI